MMKQDISHARNPDQRASLAALRRAAQMARKIAIQTDTALVVVRDGKLMRIPADELRAEHEARNRAERLESTFCGTGVRFTSRKK